MQAVLLRKTDVCLPFRGLHPLDTRNAAPQHIARDSRLVARHIRTQTRWSLNECVLVRIASQAVQPSQNIVAHRTWSGAMLLVFRQHRLASSATDGASVMLPASLNRLIEHCGAAIGSLIIRISWSLTFTLLQLE